MKRFVLLLAILFSGLAAKATEKDFVSGNRFTLKAKLVNPVSLSPHCGYFAFAMVMEFEIITFSDSTYAQRTIGVIITCPELYGEKFFETGKTYEIQLSDQNQAEFGWTIVNEKTLENYPLKTKLWVTDVKKIEN